MLDAALANFKTPPALKPNQSTAEFLLEDIKVTIQELDPHVDPTSRRFRTAVILMAATFVVGPRVDLLVEFTGYPMMIVAGIAGRMRACGLWSDDGVDTDGWFEGDKIKDLYFWVHRLVADGLVQAKRTEGGKMLYSATKSKNLD